MACRFTGVASRPGHFCPVQDNTLFCGFHDFIWKRKDYKHCSRRFCSDYVGDKPVRKCYNTLCETMGADFPVLPRRNHPFTAWRSIEAVITGLTRNQVYGNVPWVRIPPPPPNIDRSIDTMLRSILLLFISRKPAIQGICPTGVCKILCIAGFFCVIGFLQHSRLKE